MRAPPSQHQFAITISNNKAVFRVKIYAGSATHHFLLIRCIRPIRIFKLLPPVRKVAIECLSGWKEILMVSTLLASLMFVFAAFGVQLYSGKLGKCNDFSISNKSDCHGKFSMMI